MHYVYTTQNDKVFPKKVAVLYDSNNHPVDPNKVYRVITSNYLVDSTQQLKGAKKVVDVGIDTDIFVNYLKHQTEEGKLITAPILNRKEAVTPEQAEQLIKEAQAELNKQNQDSSNKNTKSTTTDDYYSSVDTITTNNQDNDNKENNSEKVTDDQSIKIQLLHNAFVYDQNGKPAFKLGKNIFLRKGSYIQPLNKGKKILISNREYYQIGENKFVKVANTIERIKKLRLKHNAFIYSKSGKVIKHGKKNLLFKKGKVVTIKTNSIVKIGHNKFYKIGRNRFIKVGNFDNYSK